MNKDLFLKKASDSIKQEGIIIKGLNTLKEVVNSFNGKIYNRRVINQVNEKVRLTTNCHFNKSEYNDNDLYIYVPQMGNIGGNRVYIKMVVDSNNRINSELTIKEIEETITIRKETIESIKKDCVMYDSEIADRNKIIKMIDEYKKKYSYRLAALFTYQSNSYF